MESRKRASISRLFFALRGFRSRSGRKKNGPAFAQDKVLAQTSEIIVTSLLVTRMSVFLTNRSSIITGHYLIITVCVTTDGNESSYSLALACDLPIGPLL